MKFTPYWITDGTKFYLVLSDYDNDGLCQVREAGSTDIMYWDKPCVDSHVAQDISPDFANSKAGDYCFSCMCGKDTIDEIDKHPNYPINTVDCSFAISGKYSTTDMHPCFFNSYAQFMAYWAEWGLTENKARGEK